MDLFIKIFIACNKRNPWEVKTYHDIISIWRNSRRWKNSRYPIHIRKNFLLHVHPFFVWYKSVCDGWRNKRIDKKKIWDDWKTILLLCVFDRWEKRGSDILASIHVIIISLMKQSGVAFILSRFICCFYKVSIMFIFTFNKMH